MAIFSKIFLAGIVVSTLADPTIASKMCNDKNFIKLCVVVPPHKAKIPAVLQFHKPSRNK